MPPDLNSCLHTVCHLFTLSLKDTDPARSPRQEIPRVPGLCFPTHREPKRVGVHPLGLTTAKSEACSLPPAAFQSPPHHIWEKSQIVPEKQHSRILHVLLQSIILVSKTQNFRRLDRPRENKAASLSWHKPDVPPIRSTRSL